MHFVLCVHVYNLWLSMCCSRSLQTATCSQLVCLFNVVSNVGVISLLKCLVHSIPGHLYGFTMHKLCSKCNLARLNLKLVVYTNCLNILPSGLFRKKVYSYLLPPWNFFQPLQYFCFTQTTCK